MHFRVCVVAYATGTGCDALDRPPLSPGCGAGRSNPGCEQRAFSQ
jgi:hypothetical protein